MVVGTDGHHLSSPPPTATLLSPIVAAGFCQKSLWELPILDVWTTHQHVLRLVTSDSFDSYHFLGLILHFLMN